MSPRGISGALRGLSGGDWLLYGAVATVALAIGVVNALSIAQDPRGMAGPMMSARRYCGRCRAL